MILVVGATGTAGLEICKRMRESGRAVRGFLRRTANPAKVERLQCDGVELAWGDLKEPATIRKALQGVESVITAASALHSRQDGDTIDSVDRLGQLALIDEARSARIDRFLLFGMHRNPSRTSPLTRAKAEVEAALRRSGMRYTILSCNLFAETWLGSTMGLNLSTRKAVYFGTGHAPVSWITAGDAAEYAVQAMMTPATRDKVLEACGPEGLSQRAMVALFESVLGTTFETRTVTEESLLAQLDKDSDPFADTLVKLQLEIARGVTWDDTDLDRLLPIARTSMATWVRSITSRSAYC